MNRFRFLCGVKLVHDAWCVVRLMPKGHSHTYDVYELVQLK